MITTTILEEGSTPSGTNHHTNNNNIMMQLTPGYRYALEEFGMTVLPGTSNDDGESILMMNNNHNAPPTLSSSSSTLATFTTANNHHHHPMHPHYPATPSPANDTIGMRTTDPCPLYIPPGEYDDDNNNNHHLHPNNNTEEDPVMYEEVYGEAYISGTIKYVYPVGYGSMRPRSCPWKLSIVVCLSFTWLSIFIVGHCSDRIKNNNYYYNGGDGEDEVDDDILELDIRWCGSRLLYCLWVVSMLITGLSAGYCGIIGYIKLRDFAVANARSLPPKISKSDYYYYNNNQQQHYRNIDDSFEPNQSSTGRRGGGASSGSSVINIYQSDGNPLFWGSYIYRPTQAAVAVTSR